jgi:transposase-like protein
LRLEAKLRKLNPSKLDGELSMKNARHYWSNHVAAIKTQGVTTSAYARQHELSLASLYRWQRKLQLESVPYSVAVATSEPKSKFVALRVSDVMPEVASPSWRCTLVLTGGVRLEMSALPDPQWLAAVGRCSQGVH